MPTKTPSVDPVDLPPDQPAGVMPFPSPEKPPLRACAAASVAAPRKWGVDLQALNRDLPPPATYPGVISDITFKDRGTDLLAIVNYEIDDCAIAPKPDYGTVAAEEGAEIGREELVRGLELLNKLCTGIGITLDSIADDVRSLSRFIGTRVLITVAHKRAACGVKELAVRRLEPLRD
jgi:hypothetical protein